MEVLLVVALLVLVVAGAAFLWRTTPESRATKEQQDARPGDYVDYAGFGGGDGSSVG